MTTSGPRTDIQATLEKLLEKHRQQIVKFKEHTALVRNASDNEHLKVFFDHLLEEEDEHLDAVQILLGKVQNLPQESHSSPPIPDRSVGHFAARDQNILTVGSLLGQRQ